MKLSITLQTFFELKREGLEINIVIAKGWSEIV